MKIKKKLISCHLYNEKKQISKIIKYINDGKILSLISDAGTPILSDPGRLLINECMRYGSICACGIWFTLNLKTITGYYFHPATHAYVRLSAGTLNS